MVITSPDNPILKKIRKAIGAGRLTDDGLAVAEGPHLIEEARRSGVRVDRVLISEESRFRTEIDGDVVAASAFRAIAGTEHSQGVLALVEPPVWKLENLAGKPSLIVGLDSVQDPGNVGTILRSAEAFGASGVVLTKGCVHPWNPKVLRASAGSLLRIPMVYGVEDVEVFARLQWLVATGEAATTIDVVDFSTDTLLWIGNEGAGVRQEWKRRSTGVRIPTAGVESLNAAVACSVILYEARRRRAVLP